eukprot:GGOE01000969.1.p1 GENE.GGOE01000969.1~~GGOE01000969.1.p1  ORF type:complete len:1186 (+),score=333.72 GGOE01000969.1:322-3558(+)
MARKLGVVTASFANCEVLMLDEKSFKDQDYFEEHKVRCFKEMVHGLEVIGIPESGDPRRTIEKWPIIQSYAVDEKGTQKFFTMAHQVVDVTADLAAVYGSVDPHGFASLMLTSFETFRRHWGTMLDNLDSLYGAHKATEPNPSLSPKDIQDFIAEPLSSYFTYGSLRLSEMLETCGIGPPAIWFGKETAGRLGSGDRPLHFTVTMHDPQSPIWCARTYFLSSGHVPSLEPLGRLGHTVNETEVLEYEATAADDVKVLLSHYALLHAAVGLLRDHLATVTADAVPGELGAAQFVLQAAQQLGVSLAKGTNLSTQLELTLRQLDFGPFHMPQHPASRSGGQFCVLQLGLRLREVFSPNDSSRCLGAVAYGDSWWADGYCPLCPVTARIPPLEAWATTPVEVATRMAVVRALQCMQQAGQGNVPFVNEQFSLGQPLADWSEDCGLLFAIPAVSNGLRQFQTAGTAAMAFEKGLLLLHQRLGPFSVVLWGQVESVAVHDDLQLNSPIVLVIRFQQDSALVASLPGDDNHCLVLCFNLHSHAKRTLLADVLPKWKSCWKGLGIQHSTSDAVPFDLLGRCHDLFAQVASLAEKVALLDAQEEMAAVSPAEQAWTRFLEETPAAQPAISHVRCVLAARATDLAKWEIHPLRPENDCFNPTVVSLHVLGGIPGSGKHRVARTVAHYIGSHHSGAAVEVVSFSMEDGIVHRRPLLQHKLHLAVRHAPVGKVHLVVVVPGYTAIPLFLRELQCIVGELNADLAPDRILKIENSSTVVNTDNFYANHFSKPPTQLLPHVLDQCTPGFVTSILIQSVTSTVTTSQVDHHLRLCNPQCDVVYSPLELISYMGLGMGDTGSSDAARAHCVLHSTAMQQERTLALPEPYLSPSDAHALSSVYLRIPSLRISSHKLREMVNRITDLKQTKFMLLLGKLHVEGFARSVAIFHGKAYRSSLSKPVSDPVVRLDQCVFAVGRNLDEKDVTVWLQDMLQTDTSIMKSVLNIEDKGAFLPSARRPLLTVESLVQEDREYIAALYRDVPLPEGCFYDGSQFIDVNGNRSRVRPDLEALCEQFVAEQNKQIAEVNAAVLDG